MLDERTLMFVLALIPGLLALVSLALRSGLGEEGKGLGLWALALACAAVASLLGALSGTVGDVALRNVFWVGYMATLAMASRRFFGRDPRWPVWAGAGIAVYLGALLLQGSPLRDAWRIALLTGFLLAALLAGGYAMLRAEPSHRGMGTGILAVGFLLIAAGAIQRAVAGIVTGEGAVFLSGTGALTVPLTIASQLAGLVLATLGFLLLATERTRRTMERLAAHDPLTGLPNRRGFYERLEPLRALSASRAAPLALAIIDLDDFKQVNDRLGHAAGDRLLIELGAILAASARASDLVARLGGEEFVAALPLTDAEGARQWAERLRETVAARLQAGELGRVTASIGVAVDDGSQSFDTLYRVADAALYHAKDDGKNRVVVA